MNEKIDFTPGKARRLRADYEAAIQSGKRRGDVFESLGHEFVVSYAYFLLEYLALQFHDPSLDPSRNPE